MFEESDGMIYDVNYRNTCTNDEKIDRGRGDAGNDYNDDDDDGNTL